jgi:putative ABC transport system permease protein
MNARALWLRAKALVSRQRTEQELADELDFHIEMQARKHRDAGLDTAEATRLARLEFGNVELVKEDARDVRGIRPLEEFARDVRYAIRALRRAPTFAIAVGLTIGLGVGINTSVFTVFNAYVLRPFDVRDPYSLYSLQWSDRPGHVHEFRLTDYDVLRRSNAAISDVAAYRPITARLNTVAATGDAVTENFFGMLGVRSSVGRTLVAEDRATPVVVLSHAAWRTRFGGDSSVVGRRIFLRGYPFQIVGVAQPGFEGLFKKPRDFWVPLGMLDKFDTGDPVAPSRELVSMLVRLNPGVSEAQGRTFLFSTLQTLTADLPDTSRVARVFLSSRASAIPPSFRSYLAFAPLAVAFALILALACANVANMLLARGFARQRELGIRLALGAERARLVRQLITESIVLALPAVAVGFAISWLAVDVGVRTLFATLPADLTAFVRLVPLHPDARVAAFAFVASVVSAVLFGLVPSLQATRLSVVQATRGTFSANASPTRLRTALVVGQISIASLLLITASVLLREAARLGRADVGLRTRDVVTIEVQDKSRAAVLAALTGSRLADTIAAAAMLPLDMRFPIVAATPVGDSTTVDVMYNRISRSYFDVLKIGITNGRGFTLQEEESSSPSVVVSESAARRLWPGANPIGRSIRLRLRDVNGGADPLSRYQDARVVGVSRDVVVNAVEYGKDRPVMYFPTSIQAAGGCCLLVRVRGDPAAARRELDANFERAVPGGVDRIDRLETFVAGAVYPYRVAYWVSLALGLIALGLTIVGVYGVVAYVVGQRTQEIGVRIALGATTRDVLHLVLGQSLRHALIGGAIGVVMALGVARVLASNIESMPSFDVVAFGSAFSFVLLSCMIAAFVPSRRAARIDPTAALRHD